MKLQPKKTIHCTRLRNYPTDAIWWSSFGSTSQQSSARLNWLWTKLMASRRPTTRERRTEWASQEAHNGTWHFYRQSRVSQLTSRFEDTEAIEPIELRPAGADGLAAVRCGAGQLMMDAPSGTMLMLCCLVCWNFQQAVTRTNELGICRLVDQLCVLWLCVRKREWPVMNLEVIKNGKVSVVKCLTHSHTRTYSILNDGSPS